MRYKLESGIQISHLTSISSVRVPARFADGMNSARANLQIRMAIRRLASYDDEPLFDKRSSSNPRDRNIRIYREEVGTDESIACKAVGRVGRVGYFLPDRQRRGKFDGAMSHRWMFARFPTTATTITTRTTATGCARTSAITANEASATTLTTLTTTSGRLVVLRLGGCD